MNSINIFSKRKMLVLIVLNILNSINSCKIYNYHCKFCHKNYFISLMDFDVSNHITQCKEKLEKLHDVALCKLEYLPSLTSRLLKAQLACVEVKCFVDFLQVSHTSKNPFFFFLLKIILSVFQASIPFEDFWSKTIENTGGWNFKLHHHPLRISSRFSLSPLCVCIYIFTALFL